MVTLDDLEENDTVVVKERGGKYHADYLGPMPGPDEDKLAGLIVTKVIEEVDYGISEGESCNAHPDKIVKVL